MIRAVFLAAILTAAAPALAARAQTERADPPAPSPT